MIKSGAEDVPIDGDPYDVMTVSSDDGGPDYATQLSAKLEEMETCEDFWDGASVASTSADVADLETTLQNMSSYVTRGDVSTSMDKLMANALKATNSENALTDEDVLGLDEPRAKFFKQMRDKNWKFPARGHAGN